MNEIVLTRGLAYSDLIRSYNVFVDDVLFGTLKSDEKKSLKLQEIMLKFDWPLIGVDRKNWIFILMKTKKNKTSSNA